MNKSTVLLLILFVSAAFLGFGLLKGSLLILAVIIAGIASIAGTAAFCYACVFVTVLLTKGVMVACKEFNPVRFATELYSEMCSPE